MIEKTLVLVKPDAVERNLVGAILHEYERNGLEIKALKLHQVDEELARAHYQEHEGKSFFEDLLNYIQRSPVIAAVLEGEDAIEKVRTLNGATQPDQAQPNTIRFLYGLSHSQNAVHASDSKASAEREIALWFEE